MPNSPQNCSAGSDRALLAALVHDAMRFAIWAAGEGITPVDGQPARAPEDFLYEYSCATDIEDWDGLAEVARDAVTGDAAQASKEQITAQVLLAMSDKVGSDTYGVSHALKINKGRAEKAAESILSLLASQPSPAATVETRDAVDVLGDPRDHCDAPRPQCSAGTEVDLGPTNAAFHRALKKFPDAFEALHYFWNEGIAGQPQAVKVTDEVLRLRAAMDYACDLLAERTYGSSARSPGHNARLHLETALAVSRPQSRTGEA